MGHFDAVALEPDALEPLQRDQFVYPITNTKLLVASWQTRLGATGRFEQRNPSDPMPLTGVTLSGTGTGSSALLLDPSRVSYDDPDAVVKARLDLLRSLPTRYIPITGPSQQLPLLPGAYGGFITHVTCFNLAWVITRHAGNWGLNLWDEISDTNPQRVGDPLLMPISKRVAGEVESSGVSTTANGTPGGAVCMVLVPKGYSGIPDTTAYTFRDDFMGAALDTSVWNRVGNVQIDPTYQWLKLTGSSSWGANGLFRGALEPRVAGRSMTVDVFAGRNANDSGLGMVGWSDGLGQSYSNFAHAVNFAGGGCTLNVYENGTLKASVGKWVPGTLYRIRITLTDTGAVYQMQSGGAIDSDVWTTLAINSSSPTAYLTPGATQWAGTSYLSDFRVA